MTSALPSMIVIAAGRGRRLGAQTDDLPKCMVPVAGRPILHRALDAVTAGGVKDLVVIRGYRGDLISGDSHPLRFVENREWATNNVLASLMCARHEMTGGFFFSYSDIVFAPAVIPALLSAVDSEAADGVLVVDRRWQDAYDGRTDHPLPEAELARVEPRPGGPAVTAVGKLVVPADQAAGEFIGLGYLSARGAQELGAIWDAALKAGGLDAPFGRALHLRQAYLSDALNALADQGLRLAPLFIAGQWREIDTAQDLARAETVVHNWG